MKKNIKSFIITVFSFIITTQLFADTLLKIGDNVEAYMKKNLVNFSMPVGKISPWIEGHEVVLLFYQQGYDYSRPKFLATKQYITFGVLQGKNPNAHYLFDTDGDGFLDYKSKKIILPLWLIINNSRNPNSDSTYFEEYLTNTFNAFQSDEGLLVDVEQLNFFESLEASKVNIEYPNRDLFYILNYYYQYKKTEPSQALLAIHFFEYCYKKRFGKSHQLISLYKLESSIDLNRSDLVKGFLGDLYTLAPDFIPAKVYEYQLENNMVKKEEMLKYLMENHSTHWIVKKL